MSVPAQNITAVILSGGRGSRLGGADKGLLQLQGKKLVEHVISRIQPQVGKIMISANRNQQSYEKFGFPVFSDQVVNQDWAGPLAGILTALQHCPTPWLQVVPADSPFVAGDLTSRLAEQAGDALLAVPDDGHYLQSTFSLLHRDLADTLQQFLQAGEHKAQLWIKQQPHVVVDFSDQVKSFININTPEDLAKAEQHFSTFMA